MSGSKLKDSQNYLVPSTREGKEDFAGKELVSLREAYMLQLHPLPISRCVWNHDQLSTKGF